MNYYGNSGGGSYLRHYRTKGSKNGYSKNPKYRPVGQQAKGKWVNGRYVYNNPATKSGAINYNADPRYARSNVLPNHEYSSKTSNGWSAMGVDNKIEGAAQIARNKESEREYREEMNLRKKNWSQNAAKQQAYAEAVNRFNSGSSRGVVNSFENPNKTYVHMQKKVGKPVKTSEYVKGTVVKGKKQSLIDKIKSKLKELFKKKK